MTASYSLTVPEYHFSPLHFTCAPGTSKRIRSSIKWVDRKGCCVLPWLCTVYYRAPEYLRALACTRQKNKQNRVTHCCRPPMVITLKTAAQTPLSSNPKRQRQSKVNRERASSVLSTERHPPHLHALVEKHLGLIIAVVARRRNVFALQNRPDATEGLLVPQGGTHL